MRVHSGNGFYHKRLTRTEAKDLVSNRAQINKRQIEGLRSQIEFFEDCNIQGEQALIAIEKLPEKNEPLPFEEFKHHVKNFQLYFHSGYIGDKWREREVYKKASQDPRFSPLAAGLSSMVGKEPADIEEREQRDRKLYEAYQIMRSHADRESKVI